MLFSLLLLASFSGHTQATQQSPAATKHQVWIARNGEAQKFSPKASVLVDSSVEKLLVDSAGTVDEGHDGEGGAGKATQQTALAKKQTRENEETVGIEIGGISHKQIRNFYGNSHKTELQRPEFKVTERLTPDGVWEPCVDDDGSSLNSKKPTNCWKGESRGDKVADLVASVKSLKFKILALEAMFKCDVGQSGKVWVKVRFLQDAKLRIFANHRLIKEIGADMGKRGQPKSIRVKVLDGAEVQGESVVVRVELVPKSRKVAKARLKVEARHVLQSFDTCMTAQAARSDCLEEMSGDGAKEGVLLRNSPKIQLPCLRRSMHADTCTSPADVCDKWRCCLSEEHRVFLKDVILAAEHQEGQSPEEETDGEHNTCVDPRYADPESWDCNCYETWAAKCPVLSANRAACLKGVMCATPEVCDDWKTLNCHASMHHIASVAPDSQRSLMQRSVTRTNASKLDISAPLEESLTGKCSQ